MISPNSTPDQPLLGAIEAGGTKIVCSVAHSPNNPLIIERFPTSAPSTTLDQASDFFRRAQEKYGPLSSLGIGTFGPVVIDEEAADYGTILSTPKPYWKGTNFITSLRDRMGDHFPITLDTDVNAAAIGEALYGIGQGHKNVAYVTVGTGIGGSMLYDGLPLQGKTHPEIGHMFVRDLEPDSVPNTNVCPFHGSCLEGRASGPAIEARWGKPGSELPDDHPAWELEAAYLAQATLNLTATWSPDIIIYGGGVMQNEKLIHHIRSQFNKICGNYWLLPPLEDYIAKAKLGQKAGIIGSLELALRALLSSPPSPYSVSACP